MPQPAVASEPWAGRRRRAEELLDRWPFAAEVLTLYRAVAAVQEQAFAAAQAAPPDPTAVPAYVAQRVLPEVIAATAASGPPRLAGRVAERFHTLHAESVVAQWLAGEELPAVDRYLARAAAAPVLEALGPAAGSACAGPRDKRHCPNCGGLPQLSWTKLSPEDLVTPRRHLECGRCASTWSYPRLTCAACGEDDPSLLTTFGEEAARDRGDGGPAIRGAAGPHAASPVGPAMHFPHMRVDACWACSRYLLHIDLRRDPRAVPLVDEMAAIPLDLYARERGMGKIQPNLMGC
jgi:FdhE protein